MTMDRLARTVREQVALGRLLPLGEAGDAAWITESAAVAALRRVADALPGVRLGAVGVRLDDAGEDPGPGGGAGEVAPLGREDDAGGGGRHGAAPTGALPYGPLRITADFGAGLDEPLPRSAERLRAVLWATARDGLGVPVRAVDLEVSGLLEGGPELAQVREGVVVDEGAQGEGARELPGAGEGAPGAAERVAAAALAVPGVLRLTRRLAGLGSGVRVRDTQDAPGRRVQVQFAVAAGHRPYEVARAVTAAITAAAALDAPGPVATAVVVTDA